MLRTHYQSSLWNSSNWRVKGELLTVINPAKRELSFNPPGVDLVFLHWIHFKINDILAIFGHLGVFTVLLLHSIDPELISIQNKEKFCQKEHVWLGFARRRPGSRNPLFRKRSFLETVRGASREEHPRKISVRAASPSAAIRCQCFYFIFLVWIVVDWWPVLGVVYLWPKVIWYTDQNKCNKK